MLKVQFGFYSLENTFSQYVRFGKNDLFFNFYSDSIAPQYNMGQSNSPAAAAAAAAAAAGMMTNNHQSQYYNHPVPNANINNMNNMNNMSNMNNMNQAGYQNVQG